MKKITFIAIFVLANFCTFSQNITLFQEPKQNGYIIYGSNKEFYPVSVIIEFTTTNLKFSEEVNKVFVIPAGSSRFKFGELSVVDPSSRYKYSYKYKTAIGDITLSNIDQSVEYELPFRKTQSFKIYQGYNGLFSHQNENSLDFLMPEGTEVLAAREGIVVQIVQNNTESCPKEECKRYNNYITIMHPDGTFAYYAHIKYNSVKLKLGDNVKSGDVLAYSGNVGWTSGPHLHFACFIGGFDKWKTLQTKFKIDKGENSILLKEGMTYTRNY